MNNDRRIEPLSEEKFHELLVAFNLPTGYDETFLFRLHHDAIEGILAFLDEHPTHPIRFINPALVTVYALHEHLYYCSMESEEGRKNLTSNEEYATKIVSAAIDKYLTNEHLEFRVGTVKSRYYPPLTTLKLYANTINGSLATFSSMKPQETLLTDIIKKSFLLVICAIDLLSSGFETEAFSTWRTLHESEAILAILHTHPHESIPVYLTHLQYGLAFHHLVGDKAKTDAIFETIKEDMKKHDLKSKDIKKFIEYGWLYSVAPEAEVRLNFRDGVQKIAGLSRYSKTYEMSSEITHSSPLLIYSRRATFYDLTLVNLYETFFRLEQIFTSRYIPELKEEARIQYRALRDIYYPQLARFHAIESRRFIAKRQVK